MKQRWHALNFSPRNACNFQRAVTSADLIFGKHVLLRKGKKNYVVVTAK
jgi:tyrosyl-tRNA synthetase